MKKMLALVMMLCMLLPACAMAEAKNDQYVSYSWDETTKVLKAETESVPEYTPIDKYHSIPYSGLVSGWYVVTGSVDASDIINVVGDVNLVLTSGAALNATKGIDVHAGYSLNIYGTPNGAGTLTATGVNTVGTAGIRLQSDGSPTGAITIHGGTVIAQGGDNGAGIGGGTQKAGGTVTIYGGTVTATGGDSGAGIGGGYEGAGGTVTICGGTVTARGGSYGAGIGGGTEGAGGTVMIYGGTVTARGGDGANDIGPGAKNEDYYATGIYGGNVDANSVPNASNGSDALSKQSIRLAGAGAGAAVSSIGVAGYGLNDVVTFADGMLHLWLPDDGNKVQDVTSGGYEYGLSKASSGNVQVFKRYPAAAHFAVTLPQDAVYNGKAHQATVTPAADVTGMGAITVHYGKVDETGWVDDAPVDAGKYQVYITLTEGEAWLGTQQDATLTNGNWTFEIQRASIDSANLMFSPAESQYTGSPIVPLALLRLGDTALNEGKDYNLSFLRDGTEVDEMIDAGTYTVKATGMGNCTGETTAEFVIKRAPIALAGMTIHQGQSTYTGSPIAPDVNLTFGGAALKEGKDYELSFFHGSTEVDEVINAGPYNVVATGKGNYIDAKSDDFKILPAELSVTIGLQNSSEVRKEYDGTTAVKADDLVTMVSGIIGADDVQVAKAYTYESANASAEKVNIIAKLSLNGTDAGNYTCPATVVALIGRIEPMNMQKTAASVPNAAYTGAAIVPQVWADSVAGAMREGVDYTVSMANEGETMDSLVEPGVYVLALHGQGNYTGVKQVTFEITAPTGGGGSSSGGSSSGGSSSGESSGGEPGSGGSSSGESSGSGTVQPDGYKLFYLLDGQKIPVGDSGCTDKNGEQLLSRLNRHTYVPDGLRHTDFNTVDKIVDELVRQTKAAGFAADDSSLLMAELGYQDEGVWTGASDEEHEHAERVRMRTELSGKVDLMNCDFLITHMFAHGGRAGKVEIIRDYQIRRLGKPGAYELSFEMNGMSPVLISMKVKAPADAAANLPKTGDPSMLGAWAALLAVSAVGLRMKKKN